MESPLAPEPERCPRCDSDLEVRKTSAVGPTYLREYYCRACRWLDARDSGELTLAEAYSRARQLDD